MLNGTLKSSLYNAIEQGNIVALGLKAISGLWRALVHAWRHDLAPDFFD